MFLPLASLSTTDVGFFATVATVIPVFAVAYVVGIGKAIGFLRPRADAAFRASRSPEQQPPAGSSFLNVLTHVPAALGDLMLFRIAIMGLLMVGVLWPGAAEYVALNALYADHASSGSKQFCLLGAYVAGLIVVGPLVARGLWITLGPDPPLDAQLGDGVRGLRGNSTEAEPGLASDSVSNKTAEPE